MKPYLLFAAACLLVACNKNEPTETAKTDYRIGGSDVNTRQDTSVNINLAVTQLAGPKEEIKLSISGLPDKVGYQFSSDKGTPDFNATLSMSIGYTTPPGSHTIKLVGTTASGATKEFPFVLKVDTVGDCKHKLVGKYTKTGDACQGYSDGTEATIAIDTASPTRLVIYNLLGNKESFKVDCEYKTIFVDYRYSYYQVTGKGFISNNNTIVFDLNFTPVVEVTQQGPFPFKCKVTLVKQ